MLTWILRIAVLFVFAAIMWGVSTFARWLYGTYGWWPFPPAILLILLYAIWFERREQKRLGVKRPIFRWHND